MLTDDGQSVRGDALFGLLEAMQRDGIKNPSIDYHTAAYVLKLADGLIADGLSIDQRRGGLARRAREIEERDRIIGVLKADVAAHPIAGRPGWKDRAHRVAEEKGIPEGKVLSVARRHAKTILA